MDGGARLIAASRFYARQGSERAKWYAWHDVGVSASMAVKAATPSGLKALLNEGFNAAPPNEYMQFGTAMEPIIMDWAKRELGAIPNDWLILHPSNPLFAATPDGISPDHTLIVEAKTTTEPWDAALDGNQKAIPITYRRQAVWQKYCTGAETVVLAWMLTERADDGTLYTPWLEPRWVVLEDDDDMLAALIVGAQKVLDARSNF